MKKIVWTMSKNFGLIAFLSMFLVGCNEPMEYRYADEPQTVTCSGANLKLMHEALYTFEIAIAEHYNYRNYSPSTPVYKENGYAQFMYSGITNTAPFVDIMDEHSKTVAKILSEQDELWVIKDDQYQVNYKGKFVSCLVSNIEDQEIREILQSLIAADAIESRLLSPPLRKRAVNTVDDPELGMIVALEGYYKNLLNRNLHLSSSNE
ncbi:hypothetical protein [Gilvibacter sediminis]|uniref:hypothetical protein n=1 Tax=Gilvibacter sediminis TaxID=379071 RepID=UPI002350FE4D|nr:hypothetical protein [Gilvibacter sediminis]MDC7998927.1 hypothetical protein [Gilvibacter sediminis]